MSGEGGSGSGGVGVKSERWPASGSGEEGGGQGGRGLGAGAEAGSGQGAGLGQGAVLGEGEIPGAAQFQKVAALLEQNKVLINQIHSNQESGDAERVDQNVGLIQTLNHNITAVVDQYKALSDVFLAAIEPSAAAGTGAASQ